MTIIAKFPGTCKKCGGHIAAGTQIEWSKDSGAQHVNCPEQPVTTAQTSNAPAVYEHTSGYVGSMGVHYSQIEGDALAAEISRAAAHHGVSVAEIQAALDSGKMVHTGEKSPNHYYDHGMAAIRRRPAPRPKSTRPIMRCKSCGQTGHRGAYPFSTNPGSGLCDDCC